MKRYLILFLCFIAGLSTHAQSGLQTTANLSLRAGPGTLHQVVTQIPKGASVAVLQECGGCSWLQVGYGGQIGYVSSRYLTTPHLKKSAFSNPRSATPATSVTYYTNSARQRVQSPTYYESAPAGATAICRDGTYSFSRSRRGTCSHHGGVRKWLK